MANSTHPPDHRLAIYRSLAPGKSNHNKISHLSGAWRRGTVNGKLTPAGGARPSAYRRVTATVTTDQGECSAWIYVVAQSQI